MRIRMTAVTVALTTLAAAITSAADKPNVAIAKAERLLWSGKADEARQTLEKLASDHHPEAYVALSHFDQRMGNLDDALLSATKAVELAAQTTPAQMAAALVTLANLELRMGAGADALSHATAAVEALATPLSLAALARAHVRVGNPAAALETAERAVAMGPGSMSTHEARGEALRASGKGPAAVEAFRRALELNPQRGCTLCDERIPELVKTKLAAALAAEGITAEAIVLAQEAAEASSQLGEAFATLGTATLADDPKRWNEAFAQVDRGAALDPRNTLVRLAEGRIQDAAGNFAQAEAAYRAALDVDPGFVPARVGLILAQVRQGQLENAHALAERLTTDFPRSGEAHLTLAKILLAQKQHSEATKPLSRAAELLPASTEPLTLLASAYRQMGERAKAVETYGRIVERDPGNAALRTFYGRLLGEAGQHAQAVQELEQVATSPGYREADAYVNLGWVYRAMEPKRLEDAVAAYRKALEVEPGSAQAALGLGLAYYDMDLWDDALAAFEAAIAVNPEVASEAYSAMAQCYIRKNDTAQARAYLEKARQAGRDVTRLEQAIDEYEGRVAESQERQRKHEESQARIQAMTARERELVGVMRRRTARPAERARATEELGKLAGARAVRPLLWALAQEDPGMREAAATALGLIGPPAREALPALRHIVETVPAPEVFPTREQAERALRESDVRRAARDAILKIERR